MYGFEPFRTRDLRTTIFRSPGVFGYEVPEWATLLHCLVVGGGGSGGFGFTRVAGAAGGGGGGGGAGGSARGVISTLIIPRMLYVTVGQGGISVQAGTSSTIGLSPVTATNTAILTGQGGNAGGSGTGAAVGAAGGATAASTVANNQCGLVSIAQFQAGVAGGAGGAVAGGTPTAVTWGGIQGICGGAGGGGTTSANFAGAAVNGAGIVPTIAGGAAGTGDGNGGYSRWEGLLFTGGSGGGSNNTGAGGRGGDGAPGCGGGGGGAGTTGGSGGTGGHGFVIITAV